MSETDVERYLERLKAAAARATGWLCAQEGDPIDLLRRMKFAEIGPERTARAGGQGIRA
jgi:hypothetical protein